MSTNEYRLNKQTYPRIKRLPHVLILSRLCSGGFGGFVELDHRGPLRAVYTVLRDRELRIKNEKISHYKKIRGAGKIKGKYTCNNKAHCDVGEMVRVPVMMIHRRSVTRVSVLGQTQTQFVRRSLLLLVCGLLEGARDE